MRYKLILFSAISVAILLSTFACNSSYDESLDDLVLGIYFGMDKDEFFQHCWDLNQNGHAQHGSLNNNVMYYDSINFSPRAVINFYPEFVDNKISELPFVFYYKGWAPWNKHELTQEKLMAQVVKWFEKKYDTTFDKKQLDNNQIAYYKVIYPLTIRIYSDRDEMLVKADIKNEIYQKKAN